MNSETQNLFDDDSPLSPQSTWVPASEVEAVRKTVLLSQADRLRASVIRQSNNIVTVAASTEGWTTQKIRGDDIICIVAKTQLGESLVSTNILCSALDD